MKSCFFLCCLTVAHFLSAQNMIQMQQLPLLTSPSFTGNDTTGRVVLAMQRYGDNSGDDQRKKDMSNEAYFASFDTRNASHTQAFGAYLNYWNLSDANRKSTPSILSKYDPYIRYNDHTALHLDKREVGLSYVPVFGRMILRKKEVAVIPALSLCYSHHTMQEAHQLYYAHDSLDFIPSYKPNWRDTVVGHKKVVFDRISLGGSLLVKSSRLFLSYHLALRYDHVSLEAVNRHNGINQHGDYFSERFDEKHKRSYLQVANTVALGLYFPKRSHSLIQFNPILIVSFNYSPVHGNQELLSFPNPSYTKTKNSYDYGDFFGPSGRRLSLNVRVWKIISGLNMGADGYNGASVNYYLGYKTPKVTVTAGIANSSVFNASLQCNFR